MKTNVIGRIISATLRTARAEFTEDVEEGMIVKFVKSGNEALARIEKLETRKDSGLTGYIYFLDPLDRPPRAMQELFLSDDMEDGILFIGEDRRGLDISLMLNPLFNHLLVAGMTRQGKTHLLLVLLEETIPLGVPSLVLDPHGEFVNLVKTYPEKAVVVEELRLPDLISHLQQRRTVIYNLLGLSKASKANRIAEVLEGLLAAKETDYAQAENNPMLLQIPPVLVFVDEAEIFAPNATSPKGTIISDALDAIINVAKGGGKFGLGLVVAPQRVTKLNVDVRGQCNSAAIFRLVDWGSRSAVKLLDYITKSDLTALSSFTQGQCLIAGMMVKRPRIIFVRNIVTERAKKVNFEEMLGIQRARESPMPKAIKQRMRIDNSGDVIDLETGEVVDSGLSRFSYEDRKAVEAAGGDGVLKRSHISPEEQEILRRLREEGKID